jgi:hypothetical protein
MTWKSTLGVIALSLVWPGSAAADKITPPVVPPSLVVSPEFKPFAIARGVGTQNYTCLPSGESYAWTFRGPLATLFVGNGDQVMTHALSPNPAQSGALRATWQDSKDSSAIWAVATQIYAESDYVAPGAIPWLKLEIVGRQYGPLGGDRLVKTRVIQRVNTVGGVAPAEGCTAAGDVGKRAYVPYSTDYVFYR